MGIGNFGYNAQESALLVLLRREVGQSELERIDYKLRREAGRWAGLSEKEAVQIVSQFGGWDAAQNRLSHEGRGYALSTLNRQQMEQW